MKTPPFKLKGVYVKKVDPKDIVNYKSSRLGNIWKATIGEKEESYYHILHFTPKEFIIDQEPSSYCVSFSFMQGEIFGLVDGFKNRTHIYADFENVKFNESHLEFEDEKLKFSGVITEDFLFLETTELKSGKRDFDFEGYRYIPWKRRS